MQITDILRPGDNFNGKRHHELLVLPALHSANRWALSNARSEARGIYKGYFLKISKKKNDKFFFLQIYDLLLAFCSLPQLQSPTCSEILKCPPTENRLTTPVIGRIKYS